MGNINAPTLEYFQSFADEMIGKFRRVNQLTPHGPSSGEYHEEILRSVLRNFLSKRFSVKSGFIYGEEGVSGQLDILIIDENNPMAYIFQEGDFAIVMPEAVLAVIEVKSTINTNTFDQSVEKIAKVKSLSPQANGIIFSFDGGASKNSTLSDWLSSNECQKYKDRKGLSPNSIIFFSKEVMLLPLSDVPNQGPPPGIYKKVLATAENMNIKASHLSIMLALIVNSCLSNEMRITRRFPTVQADRLINSDQIEGSIEKFGLGDGLIQQ